MSDKEDVLEVYKKVATQVAHRTKQAQALIEWYNNGADGQIDWGSPGDFEQCVAVAANYLDDPEGFCQLRHIDATGEPAGSHDGEKSVASEAGIGVDPEGVRPDNQYSETLGPANKYDYVLDPREADWHGGADRGNTAEHRQVE